MDKTVQKFFDDIVGEKHEASPALTPAEPVKTESIKASKPEAIVVAKPVFEKKVDPKLAAYVAEEIKQGVPLPDIKKILIAAHWPEKDVDAALSSVKS